MDPPIEKCRNGGAIVLGRDAAVCGAQRLVPVRGMREFAHIAAE